MTDDIPALEPRSGDYDAMLGRAAHRRRVRRVRALAATAPVLTIAVALAAVPRGEGATSLRPAASESATESPQPTPSASGDGQPATGPTPEERSPYPGPSPSGEPDPTPAPSGDPDPSGAPSHEPQPSSRPVPSGHPDASPRSPGPEPRVPDSVRYRYVAGYAPDDCRTTEYATSTPDAANWCTDYVGETEFRRGGRATLPFRLCRAESAGAGTLTRYGDSWFKVRALDEDGEVPWSFSRATDPKAPVITVQGGDCVEWAVSWGVYLDPGAYRLNPVFIVEEYKVPGGGPYIDITVTR